MSSTYNALGEVIATKDRNGTVHTYSYDSAGRQVSDAVTTLANAMDNAVLRIETQYDALGHVTLITSYDQAEDGQIVNQIQRAYNGFGQLTDEWQSHSGVVNTGSTPEVRYGYDAAHSSRPSGKVEKGSKFRFVDIATHCR